MNKTFIIGNLTRDPETRQVGDKTVCNFTVAVNRRQKDKDGNTIADFFRVSAWGKVGENCQKFLAKGRKVAAVGSVSVHVYSGQDGTPKGNLELYADDVEFLSPANEHPAKANVPDGYTPADDEKLPF